MTSLRFAEPKARRRRAARAEETPSKRLDIVTIGIIIVTAAATVGVQLTGGENGVRAFDLLMVIALWQIINNRRRALPHNARLMFAMLTLIAIVGLVLPSSNHLVFRTVGAGLIVIAGWNDRRWRRALVDGFLIGGALHLIVGAIGYASAGSLSDSLATFNSLGEHRASFDWLVGASSGPPLSASGLMRLQGLAGHPNEAALIFAIAALVSLERFDRITIRYIVFGVFVVGTMFTLSRFSLLALVAGILIRPAGRSGRLGRLALMLGGALLTLTIVTPDLRARLLNFDDSENAKERSAGPLELLHDATFLPDGEVLTRHNSLAWMLDVGGLLFGSLWIFAIVVLMLIIADRVDVRKISGLLAALFILAMTEDRVQSPTFLLACAVAFAIGATADSNRLRRRPTQPALGHPTPRARRRAPATQHGPQ